jgi:Flp pilus assembly protein TadB
MSQQINLINPEFLGPRRPPFSSAFMLQGIAGLAVIMLGIYAYSWHQSSQLKTQAADTERLLNAERTRLAALTAQLSPDRRSKLLEDEIRTTETRLRQYREVIKVLQEGELGNTGGYSEYMRAFARQSVSGLWLTGFAIAGVGTEIAIHGRVIQPDLVPAYLKRLNQEPVMQGRSFAALEIQRPPQPTAKDAPPPRFLEFSLRSAGAERLKP